MFTRDTSACLNVHLALPVTPIARHGTKVPCPAGDISPLRRRDRNSCGLVDVASARADLGHERSIVSRCIDATAAAAAWGGRDLPRCRDGRADM